MPVDKGARRITCINVAHKVSVRVQQVINEYPSSERFRAMYVTSSGPHEHLTVNLTLDEKEQWIVPKASLTWDIQLLLDMHADYEAVINHRVRSVMDRMLTEAQAKKG